MMNDDALSPVIGVMLILAVVVTFMAIYNAQVVPNMKAGAEIEHLGNVEESFLLFTADIQNSIECVSSGRNITFIERISLGGGDIPLNSLKSGGTLYVQQDEAPMLSIFINGSPPATVKVWHTNISYWPTSNFWQDQGYSWQYGYVNVTKGRLTTPLDFCDMGDVWANSRFMDSLVSFSDENFPIITLETVSYVEGDENHISGNGVGTLKATTTMTSSSFTDVTQMAIDTPSLPGELAASLEEIFNDSPNWEDATKTLNFTATPVTLTLTNITVILEAY